MRRLSLRVLFWSPIILWLAVEIFLLRAVFFDCGGLFGGCHGTDCSEVSGLMGIWGFPDSVIVALVFEALPIESCSVPISIAAALTFCAAGVIQWYYIMYAVELLLTRLYRRIGNGAAE